MELSFPRGGKIKESRVSSTKTKDYGAVSKPIEKKSNPTKRMRERETKQQVKENDPEDLEAKGANFLTRQSLQNDMIVMGYIKSIHSLHILVNLPGRLIGRVPITNLSTSYSNLLQKIVDNEDLTLKAKSLSEIFTPGQLVYVKVIDKCHGDREDILLSLMPHDINSEISGVMLDEGNILLTAVQEVEDHGYIMETGIKGIYGFLPKKNVKTALSIGEFIFCAVQKVSGNAITFNGIAKNDATKITTADVPNLKTLVPGSIIRFTLTKILKNGIEGLLFDGSVTAYAHEIYMPRNFSTSDEANIGKDFKARVLYIVPLSNQIMVTLNLEDPKPEDKIEFGKLINNAKVIRQNSGGILFKLEGHARGFLPKRAVVKNLKNNFDIDAALVKFSPNSVHTLRVMEYSYIEDMYLCTNDVKLLNEKIFSISDLEIGQHVTVKVVEKTDKGFQVKVGNVKGFLAGVFLNSQGKSLSVGDEVRVRVVEVQATSKLVHFTNIPGFLKESANILKSMDQVKEKTSFTGLIINETDKTFKVLFFNNIKGLFRKSERNLAEMASIGVLKVGQVKNFDIENAKNDMLFLKVPQKHAGDNLGKIMEARITSISSGSIQVFLNKLKIYGKLPITELSDFPEFSTAIFAQLKEGDKFNVVGLVDNLWSRRAVKHFESTRKLDFAEIVPGDILRCSVRNFENNIVELDCPLKNFSNEIKLSVSSFDNADDKQFRLGEIVYVQVIAKNEGVNNSLYVTPSLHKVWNNDLDVAVQMTANYLEDMEFLLKKMKANEKPIGDFSLGQRVNGKIVNLLGNKLLIELENGVFAQSLVENPRGYSAGKEIKEAAIVWIDPVQQIVHLTVNQKCLKEISQSQEVSESFVNEKKHKAIVVFSNDFISICTLKKDNQPLVFVPARFHYNDYSPIVQKELGNASSKLVIRKLVDEKWLIGVFVHDMKICERIDKFKNKITERVKRKASLRATEKGFQKKAKTETVVDIDLDTDNEEETPNSTKMSDVEDDKENSSQEDEITVEIAPPENKKSPVKKTHQTTFTRRESLMSKSKKMGASLKKSFKKKTKPAVLLKQKNGKLLPQNKDSLVDKDLVNLVSYKKIAEDTVKSPEKNGNSPKKGLKKKSGSFVAKTKKTLKLKKKGMKTL